MERQTNLLELLEYIDPVGLEYQDWINIGMALKEEGYSAADWEAWSMRDSARYHRGECVRKWNSFNGSGTPVTGGTIVQMAKERGWVPERNPGHELDWDDMINLDEKQVIDTGWIEEREVSAPASWNPKQELIKYLETLFDSTENVGYVTHSFEKDGKHMPSKGVWDRTAGQLIQELYKCSDMLDVIGDYDQEVGAWIRFNPLDGKGIKNENVTEFRYALVESDSMEIEKQNAVIRELELPVACLVHSGDKSLHAVVRVDAADYQEYRKRVDYLYHICNKNGLQVDRQNKNPSRLSRMPGIMRNGKKQFLVDTNIGKASWNEWYEWIESINDDLPEPESLESVWDHLPELSPCLIDGVLRKGHKMLIAGPSKAGKSFLQIELCIAIAEGRRWLQWQCAKGKVMYVNLELDPASCLHRFRDVYDTLGWSPSGLANIDIWNLRGKSVPMDKLAPKLIRRAAKKDYVAVVIDPIYKVITGDENSADQMAAFCNQFDKVCTELGCAVIYCHHHSKGSQGGKKSMDRASGSGVFARDPDALLDLIELETTEALIKQEENKAVCEACKQYLNRHFSDWEEDVSLDDMLSSVQMLDYCKKKLSKAQYSDLNAICFAVADKVKKMTAWRIDGTLREFQKFEPLNLWFDYPVHRLDDVGSLKDIQPDAEKPVWQKAAENRKKQAEDKRLKKRNEFEIEFSNIELDGREVSAQELADKLETSSKELLAWFGDGKRQKRDLKKDFEKYIGEDGKTYIRRSAQN
ncbi:MAG: AAA family ATPase [Lachnospiraceae bacterium]|nr:AAA family ATPase [Lachnospiraceae bacterium]